MFFSGNGRERVNIRTRCLKKEKTNLEVKELLTTAGIDFEVVVNKALNAYLPKIFPTCPFTDDLCIEKKQCIDCESYLQTKNG